MAHEDFYTNDSKHEWRELTWKLIVERAAYAPRHCRVIYLPAASDLDWPVIAKLGFKEKNMRRVDKDPFTAEALLSVGRPVVCADVFDVCNAIRERIDVVHLDFCGGLTPALYERFTYTLLNPNFFNSVFAVNMLRGRDPGLSELKLMCGKHRGEALINGLVCEWAERLADALPNKSLRKGFSKSSIVKATVEKFAAHAAPVTMTYTTPNGRKYDSVIFRNPLIYSSCIAADSEFKYRAALYARTLRKHSASIVPLLSDFYLRLRNLK